MSSSLGAESLTIDVKVWSVGAAGASPGFGTIVAAGEGVPDREALLGQHAVVPALLACGACTPCRRGHPAFCEHRATALGSEPSIHVAARQVVPLRRHGEAPQLGTLVAPEHAHRLAALSDVGLMAYAAVIRASVEPNRAAVIVGDGPLPFFVAALVKHRGASVLRVAPDVLAEDAERAVRAHLAERDLAWFAVPVIATSGHRSLALRLAPPASTVVLCDAPQGTSNGNGDLAWIVERGLSVHGLRGAHPDLLAELVAFVCKGTLDLAPLVKEAPHGTQHDAQHDSDERVPLWLR